MLNKMLLKRAKSAIGRLLDDIELKDGEVASGILVTKVEGNVLLKTIAIGVDGDKAVITRSIEGIDLADIM